MVAWSRVVAVETDGGFAISFDDRINGTCSWIGYWEQRKKVIKMTPKWDEWSSCLEWRITVKEVVRKWWETGLGENSFWIY